MHTTRLVVMKQTLIRCTLTVVVKIRHQRSDHCMHTTRLVVVKQM